MKTNIIILCISAILLISTLLVGIAFPTQTHEHVEYPETSTPNQSIDSNISNITNNPPVALPPLDKSEALHGNYYIIASNASNLPAINVSKDAEGNYSLLIPQIALSRTLMEFVGNQYPDTSWEYIEASNTLSVTDGLVCLQEAFQFMRNESFIEDANQPVIWTVNTEENTITAQQGQCYIQFKRFVTVQSYVDYMQEHIADNCIIAPNTLTFTDTNNNNN
jgi:hypothetical protein